MNESPSSPEDGADGGGTCRRVSSDAAAAKPRKTRSSRDEQHDELRKRMASRKAKGSNAEDKAQADAAHPYIPSNKPRGERSGGRMVKKEGHGRSSSGGDHRPHKPTRRVMKDKSTGSTTGADPATAAQPDELGKSMNMDDLAGSSMGDHSGGMDESGISTNSRGERRPRRSRRPTKEGEEPREHKRRDKPHRHPSRDSGEETNTDKDSNDEGTGRRDSMDGASRRRRVPPRSKSYDGPHDTEPSSGRRVPDRSRSGTGGEVTGHSRASREERIAEREERLAAKASDGAGRRASRRVGPHSPGGRSASGDSVSERRSRRRKEGDAPSIETSGSAMADHSEPSSRRGSRRTGERTAIRRNRTADEIAPRRRAGSSDLDASQVIHEDEEDGDEETKKNPSLRRTRSSDDANPRSPGRGPRRDRRASRRPTHNNPATASAAQAWVNAIDSRAGNGSIGALYGATDDHSESENHEEEGDESNQDLNTSLNESASSMMDESDQSERTGKKSRLKKMLPKSIRSAFGVGKKHHTENTTEESEAKDDLDN